jgi:DNA polymerase-3 subunit alpha
LPYTPLHLHTSYSLLDSAIQIKDLAKYLVEQGITSCAITDHGWMAGVVEFQKQMTKAGVKPIIGVEAYITDDPDGLEDNSLKHKDNYHLVILAKDNTGLKTLFSLLSNAASQNFYYKPRIYKKHLVELAGHAIVTSACLGSETAKKDFASFDPQYSTVKFLSDIFCEDFYLELQDWDDGSGIQPAYNKYLLGCRAHSFWPAQYVLTTDAHYLRKEDYKLHEIMMAMQLKKTLREYREEGKMIYGPYFYVKTDEEMKRSSLELEIPEAYENTIAIAEKCNASVELGKYHMPDFKVEQAGDYKEFTEWLATSTNQE